MIGLVTMTDDELDALFTGASSSIVRVESLASYVAADDASSALALYRQEVTATTGRGVSWERLRVIDNPPTAYQRWELEAYGANQAAGEIIRIVTRPVITPPPDYWLFDDRTAALMHYTDAGAVERLERVDTPVEVAALARYAEYLRAQSVALDEYLAGRGEAIRAS